MTSEEHTARVTQLTYTCRVCAHSNVVRVSVERPPKITRRFCEKCSQVRTLRKGRHYAESGVGING